jgi:uncharacterized membrane protein
MLPRFAILALLTLPLTACDEQARSDLRRNIGFGQAEPEQPAGPRPPAVSPLVQPIETAAAEPRPVPTVEPLTYRTTAFAAGGNAPFWNVQINGNSATYRTAENGDGRQIPVNRLTFNNGVEYIGVLDGRPFVVNLRAARCRDSVSGTRFPLTAKLTVRGTPQPGCAAPAEPVLEAAVPAAG